MPTLYTTTDHSDAILAGYDGARDPVEHGEGLTVIAELHPAVGPCITLVGPDGQVEINGWSELGQIIERLQGFQAACARRVAQVQSEAA